MSAANDVTVEALAAKVEQLGRVCAQLGQENAELRQRLSRLPGPAPATAAAPARVATAAAMPGTGPGRDATDPGRPAERTLSRRMMGKALGAAAAGVVGAAALADLGPAAPASALDGTTLLAGKLNAAESPTVLQYDGNPGVPTVLFVNDSELVPGDFAAGPATLTGAAGGAGGTTRGVFGVTLNGNGIGVEGNNAGQGTGSGVWGISQSASGQGVLATNTKGGIGVHGSSPLGRGGTFDGGAAQIQLTPGSKNTHPTSGHRGDLYADSTGRLWFCKAGGTKATWKQIA